MVVFYGDDASSQLHMRTCWQISLTEDFSSLVMDITSDSRLLALTAPDISLAGPTRYF